MAALLGVSLLFQSAARIPSLPGIAYSFPPFTALLHSRLHVRLSGFTPLLFQFPKAWEQSCCWLLKYYPSISSVFKSQNPDGYLSMHPPDCLRITRSSPHTALGCETFPRLCG